MFFSFPFFRRVAYGWFLRAHQGLAALLLYATWRHIPANQSLSRICIYVSLGSFTLTLFVQILFFCYQNGAFTSHGPPRAYVSCDGTDDDEKTNEGVEKAAAVQVVLPRPMRLDAGQYVNLWMPTVSLFSWAQTHPYMISSWSRGKQTKLDLYVKAQHGLSATLLDRARAAPSGSVSFSAFVTGPHGITEPVDRYESVLLVASGAGIAAVIPYLKKLIYGHNTSTCRTRRVHLVWQLRTLGRLASSICMVEHANKVRYGNCRRISGEQLAKR